MSTTIAPAFRVSDDLDIFRFAETVRNDLTPKIIRLYQKHVLQYAVMNRDLHSDKDFRDVILEELKEDFGRNLYFGATFLFYRNPVRDETYVRVLGVGSDLTPELEKLPYFVSDYSYWDSSDSQLESISEAEWKDRKKAWNETVAFDGKSLQYVEVKLFDDYMIHVATSLKSFTEAYLSLEYPSLERRKHDLLFSAYHEKLTQSGVVLSANEVMMAVSQYSYMRTPDAFIRVSDHRDLLDAAIRETDEYLERNLSYLL